jgi:hypothetical protein
VDISVLAVKRLCEALEARFDKHAHEVLRVGRRTVERWYGGYVNEPERVSIIPKTALGVMMYAAFDENIFDPVTVPDATKNALKIIASNYASTGYADLTAFVGENKIIGLRRSDVAERLGMTHEHLGKLVAQTRKNKTSGAKHILFCSLMLICQLDIDIDTGDIIY